MQIETIETGCFNADGGAMFGAVPKDAWMRRYPCNEANACILTMRSLIVKDGNRIMLIDNGAGNKHPRLMSYYKFFDTKDLKEELALRNISPEQITDVILTHLHFDHCGYTTEKDETDDSLHPTFPNATHWVSRQQYDICNSPHPLEKDSFRTENIEAIKRAGLLHMLDTAATISPHVSLRLFSGHTPGQIAAYILMPDRVYVFAGDVIPLAAHVSPEWISAYDMFPQTSYHEKIRMLEEAAAERQALIYCHDAYHACSTIKKIRAGQFKPDTFLSL
ncbi:MAG: MBL fold metallo-hydrolase [Tannerellaceae bacterium]|jgi:glyoxylase-like metal-dependent hydrolase (beta-lactamase superfamily II)|nr:MBL fold metallo-hydrolase [Tannerellaceae bacterium]